MIRFTLAIYKSLVFLWTNNILVYSLNYRKLKDILGNSEISVLKSCKLRDNCISATTLLFKLFESIVSVSYSIVRVTEHFVVPNNQLDCSTAFRDLTAKQRLHAH